MEALRELFLTLGLDADETKFASAQAAVDALEKAMELLAAAARFLGEQLVETIVGTADFAGTVGDAATMTGVGAERLQELGYAAVQSGSSLEEVVQSLTFLNRNLSAAAHGSAGAAEAFAKLGVRTRDASGAVRDTYTVFLEAADALSKLPPGADRAAASMDLFGRSGARLLPLFEDGAEGLRVMAGEARAMGAVMSGESIASAKSFGDGLAAMQVVLEGVRHEMGALLISELEPVLTAFKEWVLANRQLISQKVKSFIDALAGSVKLVLGVVRALSKALTVLADNWKLIAMVIGSLVLAKMILMKGALLDLLVSWTLNTIAAGIYGAQVVRSALASAAAWAASVAPVLLLAGALFVAGLAAEDMWTFIQGGDSVLGHLIKTWSQPMQGDNDLVAGLKAMVRNLADIEGKLIPNLKEAWADVVAYIKNTVRGLVLDLEVKLLDIRQAIKRFAGIGGLTAGDVLGGGAASVDAAVSSSAGAAVITNNNQLSPNFVVNAAPGQSAIDVANATISKWESWHDRLDSEMARVPYAIP
ncbi:MAG: hypothetical protein ACOZQL_10650 [Myxococcota bacterium]